MNTLENLKEAIEVEFKAIRSENDRIHLTLVEVNETIEKVVVEMSIAGIANSVIYAFSYESITNHAMQKRLVTIAQFNIAKGNETIKGI